jgi:maltooligosyltrehalose trehalohydrolase
MQRALTWRWRYPGMSSFGFEEYREHDQPKDGEVLMPNKSPFGPELTRRGVRFRFFAPLIPEVKLAIMGQSRPLRMETRDGWHELETTLASVGTRYQYVLPNGMSVPDPASRFQPEGLSGMSEVIDHTLFEWTDRHWQGRPWEESILYEIHVGTFTPEGTFCAAADKLDHLCNLGVTAIELMAIAEFPGDRGWSYDGVLLFAPHAGYGTPDDLRALVDAAHSRGIAVILDVVYNHLGNEGNFVAEYFPEIYSARHETPWGKALNFDGPFSREVREFIVQNAIYWIEGFHVDGLRLDASHTMIDESPIHILDELQRRVSELKLGRTVHLVLEHEANLAQRTARDSAGKTQAYAAQWNYDITRLLASIYGDVCQPSDPDTEAMALALAKGFVVPLYSQGAVPPYLAPPTAMVAFIQTHDLVGNRIRGDRITEDQRTCLVRALACIYLLSPQIPMLFMGEEWGASSCFPFFSDYKSASEIASMRSRRRGQFEKIKPKPTEHELTEEPDPQAASTFQVAKLKWEEIREPDHAGWLQVYRQIIARRRERIIPLLHGLERECGVVRVIGHGVFEIEWTLANSTTLKLAANLCANPNDGFSPQKDELLWLQGEATSATELGPWTARWTISTPAEKWSTES